MISENCCIFIVLNYKELQTIIAMITESKVIELFCMADEFCKFFDAMMTKYTLKPAKKRKYHRDSTMSRQKSCSFWFFFMIRDTVVWSISIWKRSASICGIFFQRLFLITVLLNWKKRWLSHWLCLSRRCFWASAQASVSLTVPPYGYAKTRESISIKRSRE